MHEKLERLHFMDSMRATLMVLGVVLHSAEVYNPYLDWIVHSSEKNEFMGFVVHVISTFRMPAFFVVSGYFCFLTMRKYKVKKFLSVRLTRILVPLVVTALTLNMLQAIFLHQFGLWPPLWEYLRSGVNMGHLWFLVNLAAYFLIASLLALLIPAKLMKFIMRQVGTLFDKVPMIVFVLILPVLSFVQMTVLSQLNILYFNIHGIYGNYMVMVYLPFFFFGVLLGVNKDSLHKFSTINPVYGLIIVAVSVFLLGMIDTTNTSSLTEVAIFVITKMKEWGAVSVCFFVFYKLLNKQSRFMRLFSDASYTIYLFHHILVVMLAVLLVHLQVPPVASVLLMIMLVTAVTFTLHTMVISKSKVLSFLYNGK